MSGWLLRILIGAVLLFLAEFYFLKRCRWLVIAAFPKAKYKKFKVWKIVFLVFLNLYPAVLIISTLYRLITENRISAPESFLFDYLFVYPFWILFLFMFQTGVFFLVIDLLKPAVYPFYKNQKEKVNSYVAKVMFVILIFFAVYVPIRIIYDYKNVSLRIVEYKKKNLPDDLAGFKIAFIADVQADKYTDEERLQKYIDEVNSTNPDLVLIAGDLITSTPDYINKSAEFVRKINSKYGVYTCIGDHDNWAYRNDYARSLNEVKSALSYHGVRMIDNDIKKINVDGAEIAITFVTNTYVETVSGSILDSLSGNNNGNFKIFLTHQPQKFLIESAEKNDFDLFLAGHTHGGQITLLFPFVYITPTMFETKYIRGNFWFDEMLMIVNRGLGMSLAPIRYNSTPEVTLIVLNSDR